MALSISLVSYLGYVAEALFQYTRLVHYIEQLHCDHVVRLSVRTYVQSLAIGFPRLGIHDLSWLMPGVSCNVLADQQNYSIHICLGNGRQYKPYARLLKQEDGRFLVEFIDDQ